MKVNGTDHQSQLGVYRTTQVLGNIMGTARLGNSGTTAAQQDRVDLSGRARLIADAQRAVAFVSDVRESLVAEVQIDLENGTYVFDNQRSAEGILRESMVNEAAMYY